VQDGSAWSSSDGRAGQLDITHLDPRKIDVAMTPGLVRVPALAKVVERLGTATYVIFPVHAADTGPAQVVKATASALA